MELQLTKNVLCKEESRVEIDGVATLIGKNGSGKTIILESILQNSLCGLGKLGTRIVSFTSGQNEGFSRIVQPYLTAAKEKGMGVNLNCFHFDKTWAKLLIFLAIAILPNGRVRKFLADNGYLSSAASVNSDANVKIKFRFRVGETYRIQAYNALNGLPSSVPNILATPFHEALTILIKKFVNPNYEFEEDLDVVIELNLQQIREIGFRSESVYEFDGAILDFHPIMNFFARAAANNEFIDRDSIELTFSDIEMDDLSDGEFQLLCLYALFDLFESENTLFLIDEADSHVHYENNMQLWSIIHKVKGCVITTTHQIESISAVENQIHHLKYVDRGRIVEDLLIEELATQLNTITPTRKFKFDLYAKLDNLVIMDHIHDWVTTVKLMEKLAREYNWNIDCLKSITPIGVNSSCVGGGNPIGLEKLHFVDALKRYWNDNGIKPRTKRIIMICDRDKGDFEWQDNGVELKKDGVKDPKQKVKKLLADLNKDWPVKVDFGVWKQMEIENYMLSYTALEKLGLLHRINNDNLALNSHLQPNQPCDNDDIRKLDVKAVIRAAIGIKDSPFDAIKVQDYIDLMLVGEISEDVRNLLKFIIGGFK